MAHATITVDGIEYSVSAHLYGDDFVPDEIMVGDREVYGWNRIEYTEPGFMEWTSISNELHNRIMDAAYEALCKNHYNP